MNHCIPQSLLENHFESIKWVELAKPSRNVQTLNILSSSFNSSKALFFGSSSAFFCSVMKMALPTAGKSVFHAFLRERQETERGKNANNGDDRSIKTNRNALTETWQTQMIPAEHTKKHTAILNASVYYEMPNK